MSTSDQDDGKLQIGGIEFDALVLDGAGVEWNNILLGREPHDVRPGLVEQLPGNGWRVIQSTRDFLSRELIFLAAPSTVEPGQWISIQLSRQDGHWSLAGRFEQHFPGATRSQRRKHLRLDWSCTSYQFSPGGMPHITAVITNDSSLPWGPTDLDANHVQGLILDSRGRQVGNKGAVYSNSRLLPPLAAGESAVLPVSVHESDLLDLPAGHYQIFALLVALEMGTESAAELEIRK